MDKLTDKSYHIREIEVDPTWIRDFSDDYRAYRKKWAMVDQGYLFDFPLFLEVDTSYACNYQCPNCPRHVLGHTEKVGFLNNDLLNKIFDEVKKYRMPSIDFSHAGEPLMRKDLPELIRKAKDSYILDRMFHTNGMLLNKELSAELIESGLTKINFSLDAASSEVYKKVRIGGDYDKVISNIYHFLEAKKKTGKSYPRVRVSFVICEQNKHEQEKFYNLWKDKVNIIAFQQLYNYTQFNLSNNIQSENYLPIKYRCAQLWQLLTITWEGDILVCERDYAHNHIIGNLKTHSIYECWHSDTLNKFRKLHKDNCWHEIPMCHRCIASVQRNIGIAV